MKFDLVIFLFASVACCACSTNPVTRISEPKTNNLPEFELVTRPTVDNSEIVSAERPTPQLANPQNHSIQLASEPDVELQYTWRMLNDQYWNEPTLDELRFQAINGREYALEIALDWNLRSAAANEKLAKAQRDLKKLRNPRDRVNPERPWSGGAPGSKYIAGGFDSAHVYRRP